VLRDEALVFSSANVHLFGVQFFALV
jgi:hypothetical protein